MGYFPKFKITSDIANALNIIERARGFLEAATLSEDWIKALQKKNLILEAHSTTHIEGTQLTLEQSEQILSGEIVKNVDPDDVKELLNYRKAFDFVADYLTSGNPLTEGLIREIHKLLVQEVRGNSAAPGEYRKIQNFVVNSVTKEVIYTPPPVYEVPMMMADLIDFLNRQPLNMPSVLLAGIAQFQFVHIHPFLDGNGRTARLLSTLVLYQHGYDFKRLFTISAYYDQNRSEYYKAIQSVRNNEMDMTGWLEYFTKGLANQLKEVRLEGERIIKADVLLSKSHLKERSQILMRFLIEKKKASILECEKALQFNRRSLQRDIKGLIEKGFIREVASSQTDPTKLYESLL